MSAVRRSTGRLVRRQRSAYHLSVVVTRGRGLIAELEIGARGPRPVRAVPFLFAKDDWQSLRAALHDAVRGGGWRARQVSFALGGDGVRHGVVEVPLLPNSKLDRLLTHEAAALAGATEEAAPITGYTWGYHRYPSAGGAQQVLLALADRQLVDAAVAAVVDAGLMPARATTIEIAGLQRLLRDDVFAESGLVAHVAVDDEETSFTVFDGERLVFNRALLRGFRPMGGASGTVGPEERAALERLALELQRTTLYIKREMRRPVELMVIGGIPRAAQAAREVIAEHLRLPLAWESLPPEGMQAEAAAEVLYLAAVGAALSGRSIVTIDLLPHRSFDERHPWVGWEAVAAGVALWVGAGAWVGGELAALRGQTTVAAARLAGLQERYQPTSRVIDGAYRELQDRRAEIDRYLRAAGPSHAPLTPTAAMAILGAGLPGDVVLLDCLLERVGQAWWCTLRGALVVASRAAAERSYQNLLTHLERSPYVTLEITGRERVPPTSGRAGKVNLARDVDGGSIYPFEITCHLAVPGEGR